jgi:hypothetical protein
VFGRKWRRVLDGSHSTYTETLLGNPNGQLQLEVDTAPPPASLAKGP